MQKVQTGLTESTPCTPEAESGCLGSRVNGFMGPQLPGPHLREASPCVDVNPICVFVGRCTSVCVGCWAPREAGTKASLAV